MSIKVSVCKKSSLILWENKTDFRREGHIKVEGTTGHERSVEDTGGGTRGGLCRYLLTLS